MKPLIPLTIILLTSTIINCNTLTRSSKLLPPPPRHNNYRNPHNQSHYLSRNKARVSKVTKIPVKFSAKQNKNDENVFISAINSFLRLFSIGDKLLTSKISVKIASNKKKPTRSKTSIKRIQKASKKLPHKLGKSIPVKKPIFVKHQKRPKSLSLHRHPHVNVPVNQRLVNYNKLSKIPNDKSVIKVNNPINAKSVPNKSEIKKLVVELHNTVADILKHQNISQTDTFNNPHNGAEDGIPAQSVKNHRNKEQKPGVGFSQNQQKVPSHQQLGSGSKSSLSSVSQTGVKENHNKYQTSFISQKVEKAEDIELKDENQFKPFVPNFIQLEAGEELSLSDSSQETFTKMDENDADKANHRTLAEGVEIPTDVVLNTIDHLDDRDCTHPVANCYEKLLDNKIVELQQEMSRLEQKYWGNKI